MNNEHGDDVCPAHSGMETRNRVIIWLLGILITLLITIGGAQTMLLMELKTSVASFGYRFTVVDDNSKEFKDRLNFMDQRLSRLETERSR